jgi:hypothetical protein
VCEYAAVSIQLIANRHSHRQKSLNWAHTPRA